MYYRRKVILAVLQQFGGNLEKIQLQKLLLLFSKRQATPDFHFVPYKYGCYSFQVNADLFTMTKYSQVKEENKFWQATDPVQYVTQLKVSDQVVLKSLWKEFKMSTTSDLIRHTYLQFPYYAISSTIAAEVLNPDELEKVKACVPKKSGTTLFTIGYEGISLEQYLNKLILADVKVLCDVRNNPLSMKYGFSKKQLQQACEGVGIIYQHFPQLGIRGELRKELNTQKDYNILFGEYKKTTLAETLTVQEEILALLNEHKRIALTCFEENICQCHRKPLAESIASFPHFRYEVQHI